MTPCAWPHALCTGVHGTDRLLAVQVEACVKTRDMRLCGRDLNGPTTELLGWGLVIHIYMYDQVTVALPVSVTFEPVWCPAEVYWMVTDCFWKSHYLIPLFDQFLARQVDLDLSKVHTPFPMPLVITDLDSLKTGWPHCHIWMVFQAQ